MTAKFMPEPVQKPEALPWLEDAPHDEAADWVRALRATGAEAFAASGLPVPKQEGWQYTNLRPLSKKKYRYSAAPVAVDALPAPVLADAARIVLVNGQFRPELSSDMPEGVSVMSLLDAAAEDGVEEWLARVGTLGEEPFRALNAAHVRDGLVLRVKGDVERPVEVLLYNTGDGVAIYPRLLYWLAPNAGLTLIERHCGEGAYFANSVADAVLEQASRLKFYRFMEESAAAQHFSYMAVQQHKASDFEGFSMATGAEIAREEFKLDLIDSVISASIKGVYMLKGKQNHDFTVQATHFEPDGKSAQFFKGVSDAQARAVYQGKIHVRRPAQKTDGYQSHHALLLSRQAEACFKPELEIYADDVKCSHGATSGHLDPDALFYLRSRGIPEAEAKDLLIESFLNEAVEQVSYAPVRDVYRRQVALWLRDRRS